MAKSPKSSAAQTSADIRAAIAAIDVAALETEHKRLIAERRDLLLTAPDDQIIAHDIAIARASIAVDRAIARADDLTAQLADAEAVEAEQAFRSAYDDAVVARDAVLRAYSDEYAKAARAIAAVVEAEKASAAQIAALIDDQLERYGLPRPTLASVLAWGRHFLSSGVSLADASLPPTKGSPALGSLAHAPLALQPELGA